METINIKDVPLDIRQQKLISIGDFYQNDTNVIKFIVNDNKNPADLSNVDEILINYKTPNGEIISRLVETNSNIIDYQLSLAEMKTVGLGKLVMQFFSNNKRLSTFIINVSIKKSIEANFEFEEGESPLVSQLFERMKEFNERLENLPIGGGGNQPAIDFSFSIVDGQLYVDYETAGDEPSYIFVINSNGELEMMKNV